MVLTVSSVIKSKGWVHRHHHRQRKIRPPPEGPKKIPTPERERERETEPTEKEYRKGTGVSTKKNLARSTVYYSAGNGSQTSLAFKGIQDLLSIRFEFTGENRNVNFTVIAP